MTWNTLTFPTKGYGRIFCKSEEDVNRVKEIIKGMDSYEYEYYLPKDLITAEQPTMHKNKTTGKDYLLVPLSYTHKFNAVDLNELQMRCFMEGIPIAVWIGGGMDYAAFDIEGDSE